MSKGWWAFVAMCLVGGAALAGTGFLLFDTGSLGENLIAESFGLVVSLGVVIALVEGQVLTRQKRIRETLQYRRMVLQEAWDINHIFAREIAQLISGDFEPAVDLYGHERGNWREFEPLLRQIFRRAQDVRHEGGSEYESLTEESALRYMESCRVMEKRLRTKMSSKPDFNRRDVLGALDMNLLRIISTVERAERLNLAQDAMGRYETVGEIGETLLDTIEGTEVGPWSSELW